MTSKPRPSHPKNPTPSFDSARIAAQLRKWQERLLDLTKANPLLGINRSRVSKLLVLEPDAATLFDRAVVEEETIRMPLVRKRLAARPGSSDSPEEAAEAEYILEPGDLSFDAKPLDLSRRLRRIYDNARTTVEERGVTTLHLAFGTLKWEEPALGESVSPIWLVPCQFEYAGPNTALRLQRADEEMQLNPALELYLRERHHISLPPIPDEPNPGDLAAYFQLVREAVREQGWSVSEDVWLSTFSFESLVIYQDLKVMAETASTNKIVAALARAGSTAEGSEALGENLDEMPTPDRVPVPVLPADSSQLRALTLAAGTRNLVVHGPPGTGKSQTISNLIADALGRGQSVLFVSAKMAALDVVHDRLAERGLARFCLEAHSTKAGKAKIIEELKRTLETTGDGDGYDLGEQLEELRKVRADLNDYVVQLHERREPLGLSVYQAIGRASKLYPAPNIGTHSLPWEDLLAVSRADLQAVVDLLDELGAQAAVFDVRNTHPWRGLAIEPKSSVREDVMEQALMATAGFARKLLGPLQVLTEILGPTASALPIERLRALTPGLAALADCERLPAEWHRLALGDLQDSAKLLEEAEASARELRGTRIEYERYVAIPASECQALLAPLNREFRPWTRVLRPGYYSWLASIRKHLTPGTSAKLSALRSYLALANRMAECEAWHQSHDTTLLKIVDSAVVRDPIALAKVAAQHRTAAVLRAAIDAQGLAPAGVSTVSPGVRAAAQFVSNRANDSGASKALSFLSQAWPAGFVGEVSVDSTSLPSLLARCEEVLGAFPRLHEWVLLCHTLLRCREAGLAGFIDALGDTSARQSASAFQRRFYTLWTSRAMERSPALRLFSSERRTERVERFRHLDAQIRESALGHIKAVASGPAQNISSAQTNLGSHGEVGILRRELQKRKRIKPLRKLFAEIPAALQALKPCMLMSPLSVSTFLKPGSITFDLVVFDEASQLPTPEAIPSILRAKQVVVAGDEKQLPPSSFFAASVIFDEDGDEDEGGEDLEPLESLLDDCIAITPVFTPAFLNWHYRSRDERLINFSNHYFYNNSLITFPSATTSDEGRGVHHVYVSDGVWDRGRSRTNRREAQRVAQLVVEQFERFPERSVGVVAMNATQREAIEVALNELAEQRPDISPLLSPSRPEPFFVKALENVQGDERDTMIMSVGYAKTQSGALSLNFGPLNRDGGWRRLNVLVTRAKWQTILVTSIRSQDLGGVVPTNRGAFMLRKFIEYAEQGGTLPPDPATLSKAETNDFEEAVAEALRQSGLEVDEQVGVGGYRIDLAVRDSRDRTRYLLGIECDGATYHSAKIARDRDLLRQQVLVNQGWRIHRLWSTDWFRDREKALQNALRSVALAAQAPPLESVEAPPTTAPPPPPAEGTNRAQVHPMTPPASRRFGPGRPYRKYRPSRRPHSDGIMNPDRVWELGAQIAALVSFEGPICEELLLDRLKETYGVSRAGSNIQDNVRRATAIAVERHGLRLGEDKHFIYEVNAPLETFRVPGDDVERTLAQVPPEEIELAVLFAVEDQFGLPRDHLPRAVAGLFEIRKANAGFSETVSDVVDGMIERGRLRLSGPNVYLA